MDNEQQIQRLLYQYARCMDGGDFTGIARLFEHGEMGGGGATLRGYAEVLAHLRQTVRVFDDGTPRTRHVTTNTIIDVDAEAGTAHAWSYCTVFQKFSDSAPLQPIHGGRYHDEFRLADGEWRFSRREKFNELCGDLSHHLIPPRYAGTGVLAGGPAIEYGVRQTLYRYCHAVDRGAWPVAASCFTADASVEVNGEAAAPLASYLEHMQSDGGNLAAQRHEISNVLLDVGVAGVASEAYFAAERWLRDDDRYVQIVVRGRYRDTWECEADGWLISRRIHLVDMRTVNGEPAKPLPVRR
jgi:SnoaL-like protein